MPAARRATRRNTHLAEVDVEEVSAPDLEGAQHAEEAGRSVGGIWREQRGREGERERERECVCVCV